MSLKPVDVILLDQGQTFMFDNDRFGPDVDYFATYASLGGRGMDAVALRAAVDALAERLSGAPHDAFPTVSDAAEALGIPREEHARLDDLIAVHELGTISLQHAEALRSLAYLRRLGVVSNIWARPRLFLENLERAGVRACFEHLVWSSEHGCIKPCAKLFERALAHFATPPQRVLFVGDHPSRDIEAAHALGIQTAWVRAPGASFPEGLSPPDIKLDDLCELEQHLERVETPCTRVD